MNDIGLTNKQLNLLLNVFSNNNKIIKAVVFGSRAKGSFRANSDVDIALYGGLTGVETEELSEELDNLPLPYKFDVLAYDSIDNGELKEHIDRVGVTIWSLNI